MPLARIHVPSTMAPESRTMIGDIVYETMREVIGIPRDDKFQIIQAHEPDALRIDPSYLGVTRSDAAFVIDITLNAGRTVEVKKAFYAAVVERLVAAIGIRPEDVLIVLTEVSKENWSFGNGIAQYAE